MNAGLLREFVQVQEKVSNGTGDRGQPLYTWTTVFSIYADIEPLMGASQGKKFEMARQLVPTATHLFTIRYLSALVPEMRFVDSVGNIYNINYLAKGDKNQRYFLQTVFATQQEGGI